MNIDVYVIATATQVTAIAHTLSAARFGMAATAVGNVLVFSGGYKYATQLT